MSLPIMLFCGALFFTFFTLKPFKNALVVHSLVDCSIQSLIIYFLFRFFVFQLNFSLCSTQNSIIYNKLYLQNLVNRKQSKYNTSDIFNPPI